jgi:LPXTG-motif cell wall-anchored protein
MLTDGNPTLGSINYTDPLSGPNVGEGAEYGVLGYYTVLSANYFKNQVSLHYNQKAYFYTIGMGIMSSGHGTYNEKNAVDAGDSLANVSSISSYVDDAYRRAVLNPTADNIEELDSWSELSKDYEDAYVYVLQEWKDTSSQFKELITNQADLSSVYQVAGDEMNYLTGLGWTCQYLYGISNPYYNADAEDEDYGINYVDNAYFGNLSEEDMEYIFSSIISKLQVVNNYNFFLEEDSSVTITDPIGTGMEVKGEPVLRYYGVNYQATSTKSGTDEDGNAYVEYKWNYVVDREYSDTKWLEEETTVDLNGITARVTTMTDSSGGTYEVVKFDISEDAMAVYYPDLYKTFYYEELPVRLIYRVGLQASVLDALKDTIGEITPQVYYTNSYDADNGMIATTTFTPTADNSYYSATRTNTTAKTSVANVTDTYDNSFKEWVDADTRQVTQILGNNGKLTISRPDSLTLTVKKEWSDDTTPADSVSINLYAVGTRVKDGSETSEQGVWLVDTVVLGDSNNWKYQWKRYPKTAQIDGYTYTYTSFFINESPNEQYAATYKNEDGAVLTVTELEQTDQTASTDDDLESIRAVAAENGGTIYIINSQLYQLPETGGIGTDWYTLGGTTILLAVFALYIYGRRKRSRLNVER